ncbi:MAG TPA: carboxypeptidase-like regulatory domain-containing protein, partial [Hanamia sp.]|nr:carboxypeptidase-like regulatory domain-containing protein [Hanamia sp.]
MRRTITLFMLFTLPIAAKAQSIKVYGKVTNSRLEPLAFASIEVREIKAGAITNEEGNYDLKMDPGKYD